MAIEAGKKKKEEEKISILLEDLTSLESYTRDLFNFLPIPVFLMSSAKIILEVNPAFEKISGYKTEEIVAKPIEEIFDEEKIESLLKVTLNKGFVEMKEMILLDKGENAVPVSVSAMLRKNEAGEIVGFFFGLFNLAEIKGTEKALKDAQAALTNMLEDVEDARNRAEQERNKTLAVITNLTDGLLVFGEENKLSLINRQAEKFFDVKARDLIDRSILELGAFPTLEPLMRVLGAEIRGVFRKEILIKKNLTLEASTVPIIREKEKLGILVILHDITRAKIIEEMKTEFVSLAAHQLRTPLSAIKWTLKMLLDGDIGTITEEQREFIEKTYQSNERMISLINDLLNITRIEEGRYLYKPVLADFEAICQFVINSFKDEIKKKKIKFEFKKPQKKLPQVKVDVEKIRLTLSNLLDNAIKYTPAGGKVAVSLKLVKEKIELSVKDTGIGIPKDQQGRVFTKFFRGANVMRMATEGSGLGLFITKNIIEAHGGKIWFESKEDKGTTFYFTLPTKEEFTEFLKEF